jgi:parallel beta-helix repeat protein
MAEIIANTITGNESGIQIQDSSTATVVENTVDNNGDDGIFITGGSMAEIIANTITGNRLRGVDIGNTSQARVIGNNISDNAQDGIFISGNSTEVEIARTTITGNDDGIRIQGSSSATIGDGVIGQNRGNGIFLTGASTATICSTGGRLNVTQNGGAGILVSDDSSLARINTDQIVFSDNAEGDIVGPVERVCPERGR